MLDLLSTRFEQYSPVPQTITCIGNLSSSRLITFINMFFRTVLSCYITGSKRTFYIRNQIELPGRLSIFYKTKQHSFIIVIISFIIVIPSFIIVIPTKEESKIEFLPAITE